MKEYPFIYGSIGTHPCNTQEDIYKLRNIYSINSNFIYFLKKHKEMMGLGETGLDYNYTVKTKNIQIHLLKIHVRLSIKYGLPIIIHTRNATKDTILFLKKYEGIIKGIVHCFSDTKGLAQAALTSEFYISVSGIPTFKKSVTNRSIIKNFIPTNRMLVETDSPYLSPTPLRNKNNEPSFIQKTISCIANIKQFSIKKLSNSTSKNFFNLIE